MSPRTPSYRLHKPTGNAVVTLGGRDRYLGKFGSPGSRAEYDRLVAEWLANGRRPAGPAAATPSDLTINEILLKYWRHAESHYREPGGGTSSELGNVKDALRHLRKLYGATRAVEFGPKALKSVRDAMVRSGLARSTVNARVNRIRRAFKWAAAEELVPIGVLQALKSVEGLQKGRSGVREAPAVEPIPAGHVEAVLPHLTAPVAALVQIQLLTGCRAGEAMRMRGRDLTAGEPTWEYRPPQHKNSWRGSARVIPLGPQAQEIVKGFLKPDLAAYLFSPADAVAAIHIERSGRRTSKPTPSERSRKAKGGPGARHAPRYTRQTYLQAIVRACRKAGVPQWSPLRLRHTAATSIRAQFGLEGAQNVLGHAKPDTTLIYAERDLARAREIMAAIG